MLKPILLSLALSLFLTANAQRSKRIDTDNFEMTYLVTNSGDQKSQRESVYQFRLLRKENGNTVYQCKLVKARIFEHDNQMNDVGILINTADIRKMNFNTRADYMPVAILNKPLIVTIDAQGKLINIEGVNDAVNQAADIWQFKKEFRDQLIGFAHNYPANEIQQFFLPLPHAKLTTGAKWLNTERQWNYSVTTKTGDIVTLTSHYAQTEDRTRQQPAGTTKGTYVYNSKRNLITNSKIVYNYKATGFLFNQTQATAISSKLRNYPTDTTWFNMYAMLNQNKNKIFDSKGLDTAWLMAYFKTHDELYNTDKHYRASKLELIQRIAPYDVYFKEMFATPNSYLANSQIHLINKLLQLSKLTAADAYDASTYIYKTPRFDEWLQNTFAGYFIENRKATPDEKKYQVLVNMYSRSPIEGIRQKTTAFTLWANARLNKDDAAYLTKTADSLLSMDHKATIMANADRYSLMVYNMLQDVKKPELAETLINKTISNLETNIADSAKYDPYWDKSLLAYAYYSKYLTARPIDPVKASQYLAMAATNSPTGKNPDQGQSSRDRDFLRDVKESYRDMFMDDLFKNKDIDQALDNFVKLLNSQPKNIAALENSFKKYLPDSNFKAFFTDKVVSTWQPAPAFSLKGVDNKTYDISNYKNQWLVIDFWGTWCQPCRMEMPEIDRFNAKLGDAEHKGIRLLSIACNDTPEKVTDYMGLNKFKIPVAMADNTVQRQYNISSYPSKVLIAPNGRMLALESRIDWIGIIEKFAKLYPGK